MYILHVKIENVSAPIGPFLIFEKKQLRVNNLSYPQLLTAYFFQRLSTEKN